MPGCWRRPGVSSCASPAKTARIIARRPAAARTATRTAASEAWKARQSSSSARNSSWSEPASCRLRLQRRHDQRVVERCAGAGVADLAAKPELLEARYDFTHGAEAERARRAVVTEGRSDTFEQAGQEAECSWPAIDLAHEHAPARNEPALDAGERCVLIARREVVQDVDQEHAVGAPLEGLEGRQVADFEALAVRRGSSGDVNLPSVGVEARELADLPAVPQK